MVGPGPRLTERERDVLVALCRPVLGDAPFTEPASIRRIAEELVVTEAAVKQHLLHLYDKFGLHDETDSRRVRLANEALARESVSLADLGGPPGRTSQTRGVAGGRAAAARGEWEAAFEQLSRASASGGLDARDLELLGHAAFWTERPQAAIDVRQRAHAAYLDAGDLRGAARLALDLSISHIGAGRAVVAGGWLETARRLIERLDEGRESGQLAAIEALVAIATRRFDRADEEGQRAIALGERFHDDDTVALGQAYRGYALVRLGRHGDGLVLLDQVMAAAIGGRLGPLATDQAFCRTLGACLESWDYRRAAEWADAVLRLEPGPWTTAATGDCRTHRVAVDIMRGEWQRGEAEASTACLETEAFDQSHVAVALAELGEIRLRSGDLTGAESALRRAHALGGPVQPGMALLDLAGGEAERANRSLSAALEAGDPDPLARAALLPALVECAVAAGDLERARQASVELDRIATSVGAAALVAAAACAAGTLAHADGDVARAVSMFRTGWRGWMDVGAPYEAARARLSLARALAGEDRAAAELERAAALAVFERLGAAIDVRLAARSLDVT